MIHMILIRWQEHESNLSALAFSFSSCAFLSNPCVAGTVPNLQGSRQKAKIFVSSYSKLKINNQSEVQFIAKRVQLDSNRERKKNSISNHARTSKQFTQIRHGHMTKTSPSHTTVMSANSNWHIKLRFRYFIVLKTWLVLKKQVTTSVNYCFKLTKNRWLRWKSNLRKVSDI